MAKSNPLISQQITNLRGDQTSWRTVKQKLQNQEADVALLKNFFEAWASQGYDAALGTLPADDPQTGSMEGVSEEDIHKKAEEILDTTWDTIDSNMESHTGAGVIDTNDPNNNDYLDQLMQQVRTILGKMSLVDGTVESITNEIQDLTTIQQSADLV